MPNDPNIPDVANPANYIPPHAIAFGGWNEDATFVDADHPLPVGQRLTASSSTAVTGSTSSSVAIGPFTPELGRPIWLTLSDTWSGVVTIKRSVDGGTTKTALTLAGSAFGVFTANCNEQVAEETESGAEYYLDVALASGTLTYRVSQ